MEKRAQFSSNFALKKLKREQLSGNFSLKKVKRQPHSGNFAMKKCTTRGEDRIGQLPDDILVYILSLLTLKEAKNTSAISRRWLNLWQYIPVLDFDAIGPLVELNDNWKLVESHREKYVRWVDNTLKMSRVDTLHQFRVCFDLDKTAHHTINRWVEFALARNVQRLELEFCLSIYLTKDDEDFYTFPIQLLNRRDYTSQHYLNNLHKFPRSNFECLKVLVFKSVNVTGELLEFFLHNCQFLEEMEVRLSPALINLHVVGPSLKLKRLVVQHCFKIESLLICDVTNLVALWTTAGSVLSLKNAPKLTEVDICCLTPKNTLEDILPWVSCVLSQLEFLKIHSSYTLENLEHYKFPELSKLKKFVLMVLSLRDTSLSGVKYITRAAPQLKEVELQIGGISSWMRSGVEFDNVVGCPHYHLEVVKLRGYKARIGLVGFLRYFFENAIALKKIIIDPCSPYLDREPETLQGIKKHLRKRKLAKLELEGEVPAHVELDA